MLASARTFCIDVARRILPAPLVARARSLAVRRLKGDARQVFTQIHDKNIWGYEESVSGAGSTLRYTEGLRKTLPALLAELGIQSMLDLPCGDFHWLAQVELPVRQYIGADIVEPLIAKNQAAYGRAGGAGAGAAGREFHVIDLSKDALPRVDLLFCRDCLMHLSEDLIFPCLENICRSEITWLLTTSYEGSRNRTIRTGDWFPINLTAEPYNFPAPLRQLDDWIPPFDRRHLALWKIADLKAARPSQPAPRSDGSMTQRLNLSIPHSRPPLAYNAGMTQPVGKPRASTNPLAKWRRADALMPSETGAGATPQSVTPEMAAMAPRQLLNDDEIVILLTKPSLFFILYESTFFILVTLVVGAGAAQVSSATSAATSFLPSPSMIAAVMGIVCAGRLVWALLVWTSHVYMLTNQRIVTIKGVVNTHMFQAHLRKIQRTDLYRPLIQKIFGTGTIGISTAAAAGDTESTWVMVARPLQTQEQIVAAINKAQSK